MIKKLTEIMMLNRAISIQSLIENGFSVDFLKKYSEEEFIESFSKDDLLQLKKDIILHGDVVGDVFLLKVVSFHKLTLDQAMNLENFIYWIAKFRTYYNEIEPLNIGIFYENFNIFQSSFVMTGVGYKRDIFSIKNDFSFFGFQGECKKNSFINLVDKYIH